MGRGWASRLSPTPLNPPWCPQEDKDLVPEFVHSEGLSCLTRVGAAADHNYQSYILRGQPHPSPMIPMSTTVACSHSFWGIRTRYRGE